MIFNQSLQYGTSQINTTLYDKQKARHSPSSFQMTTNLIEERLPKSFSASGLDQDNYNQVSKTFICNQTKPFPDYIDSEPSNKQHILPLNTVMEVMETLKDNTITKNIVAPLSEQSGLKVGSEIVYSQPIHTHSAVSGGYKSSDNLCVLANCASVPKLFEHNFGKIERASGPLSGEWNNFSCSTKQCYLPEKMTDHGKTILAPQNASVCAAHVTENVILPSSNSLLQDLMSSQHHFATTEETFPVNEYFESSSRNISNETKRSGGTHSSRSQFNILDQSSFGAFGNPNRIALNNEVHNYLYFPQQPSCNPPAMSVVTTTSNNAYAAEWPKRSFETSNKKKNKTNTSILGKAEQRRIRNNIACRRARQRRKERKLEKEAMAISLSRKNTELLKTVETLENEIIKLKSYYSRYYTAQFNWSVGQMG